MRGWLFLFVLGSGLAPRVVTSGTSLEGSLRHGVEVHFLPRHGVVGNGIWSIIG